DRSRRHLPDPAVPRISYEDTPGTVERDITGSHHRRRSRTTVTREPATCATRHRRNRPAGHSSDPAVSPVGDVEPSGAIDRYGRWRVKARRRCSAVIATESATRPCDSVDQ